MRSGLTQLVSGLTADISKIFLDFRGSGYDRFHGFLEQIIRIPPSRQVRFALVGGALLMRRLMSRRNPGNGGLVADLADDGFLETLKRILEHAEAPISDVPASDHPKRQPLLERLANFLVPDLGR